MFDYETFLRDRREITAAHPGATSYQIALMLAERRTAATQAARSDWWCDCALWDDDTPAHSDVEHDCFRRLFWTAWRMQFQPSGIQHRWAIAEWRPLRAIHAARGERLDFIPVGKGQTVSVLVRDLTD